MSEEKVEYKVSNTPEPIETIQTSVEAVLARAYPPQIMTLQDVANYFGYSYNFTRANIVSRSDFPRKLDRFVSPRYQRDDVIAWGVGQ